MSWFHKHVRGGIVMMVTIGFSLACSLGQSGELPQAVVERYCKLDADGANFSAANPNAKEILSLLINEDEAGYDTSVIIKSYQIGKATIHHTSADVDVIYSDLGSLGGELSAKKSLHSETVTFHLALVSNAWKIDGLRIPPHITKSWVMSMLSRSRSADEHSGKNDPRLRAAIAEISRW